MRVGLIGRTHWLLDVARGVLDRRHQVPFICTAPESPGSRVGVGDFRAFAMEHDIAFFDDLGVGRRYGELDADVCLSVNWTTVLRQRFLDSFEHGVLNAHAGDLPRYRGNATLNWAILAGETQACVTVHRMVELLDAGPIALKRYRPIDPTDDMTSLSAWLDTEIPAALLEALDLLETGSLMFMEQDSTIRPLRTYPRKPQDSRIVWAGSAEEVVRLVRASAPPFGGALARTESGREIVVYRARVHVPDFDYLAVPGQVCFALDGNPVIATGAGMVELVECADDGEAKATMLSSLRNRLV